MRIDNINIARSDVLITPGALKRLVPVTTPAAITVYNGRDLLRQDWDIWSHLFMLVMGPCSVHDPAAVLRYFRRLAVLRERYGDRILFIARVFIEKHRTGMGWPGYMLDPGMDASFELNLGLELCRKLLVEVNELRYPIAAEVINPLVGSRLGDLLTLSIAGARSINHQGARFLASGESGVFAGKNDVDGRVEPAIEALTVAGTPGLPFTGSNEDGIETLFIGKGNPGGFLILRGGHDHPNYDSDHVFATTEKLKRAGLPPRLLVDCNHKQHDGDETGQLRVWKAVVDQLPRTRPRVAGLVIESFTTGGKQPFDWPNQLPGTLDPDCSITDACIGWDQTEEMIKYTYDALA